MSQSSSNLRGILFALAGYTLWVMVDSTMKIAALAAVPPTEIVTILSVIGVSTLLIKNTRTGKISALRPRKFGLAITSGLTGLGLNFFNVLGLKHLPFITFFIMAFMAPMVVSLLASAFLKERLTPGKIAAIIAGFAGVVIAVNPFDSSGDLHGDWIGYISMIGAVFCFSSNMVLQLRIMQSETADSLAFMQSLTQMTGCLMLLPFTYVPMSWSLFFLLCGSGIVNIAGNLFMIIAAKHTTAATIAQFHYTQIISGAILGFLIWHEVPNLPLAIGSAIIITSGLYIANHMRKADLEPVRTL